MLESLAILLPLRDAPERVDAFRDGLQRLSERLPQWRLFIIDDRPSRDPSAEALLLSCDRSTILRLTSEVDDLTAIRAGLSESEVDAYAIWPGADAGPVELLPALIEEMCVTDSDIAEAEGRSGLAAPSVVSRQARDAWIAAPGRDFQEVVEFGFSRCTLPFEPSAAAPRATMSSRRESATEHAGRYLTALILVGLIGSVVGILIEMPSVTLPSLALLGASLPAIVIAGLCRDVMQKLREERQPEFVVERRLNGRTVVLQPSAPVETNDANMLTPTPARQAAARTSAREGAESKRH